MKPQLQNLKVVRADQHAKVYIVEYEEKLHRVHMMHEQLGKEIPEELVCHVEKTDNGYLITQDMETLLRRHYSEGDEVMYRIEKVADSYYLLKDEFGYVTYLDKKYKINPNITPKLLCRVNAINSKRAVVELIEKISLEHSQFSISTQTIKDFFKEHPDCSESITLLLLSDEIIGSFDSECHRWIYSICRGNGTDKENLACIKDTCLTVLGQSNLLRSCNSQERVVLEDRFTTLIEQLGYYIYALEYVEENREAETIDQLLKILQETGYVFHPRKRFYIMMCIFLIKSKEEDGQKFLDLMMPKIFDTLRSCDVSNWKRQPFKLVWIRLLEFFIESLKRDEDRLSIDKEALKNMVQALALQYNLIEEDDEVLIDSILNLAMLYRHCARIGVINPMQLLNVAYYTLIGAIQEEPIINSTSDPDRMACVVSSQILNFTPDTTVSLKYEGRYANVILENNMVQLVPKEYNPDNTYDVIPEHLGLWKHLQVKQNSKQKNILKGAKQTLKPYKERWVDAERELLDAEPKQEKKDKCCQLAVDDEVGIIITRQVAAETPTFECRVVDSGDAHGEGTIRMADMVGYANPSVGLFSFEKGGHPYILDAVVIEVNPDGTYKFGTKHNMDKFCNDYRYKYLPYNSHMYCVVTGGNTLTSFYAVSEQGFSVTVHYEHDAFPIQMEKGTVIQVTCIEDSGKPGFISAVFERMASEKVLTLADAFGVLLGLYSKGDVYTPEQEEDDDFMVTEFIDKPRVRELINIIDNVASLDNDYIKTYNYLGFCKLVAKVIEDEELAMYYKNKMGLIELIYEFDVNNGISEELIQRFEESNSKVFAHYTNLYHQFRKLQIISYMGQEEHNRELCDLVCDNVHPDFSQLAKLVLSYNFMQKTNMAAEAENVKEHVKELLKLQKKDNPKKDYGQETFEQEFKTSIVCPPDSMKPDFARQTHKVMEEICAFLNAEGGVIYIGVDDKTHLERGIEDDLKYFENSRDKYDLYVRNMINKHLVPGELADHCVSTSFDSEAHSAVYVIEIAPCPQPVSINGVFYERRGTSARRVSEDYREDFISNRLQRAAKVEQYRITEILKTANVNQTKEAEQHTETVKSGAPLNFSTGIENIHTSKVRQRRHADDDIQMDELSQYINIYNDNTYSITPQIMYDCLSLGIYEEELDEALVVVYENGEVARIPMGHLLEAEEWVQHKIYNRSKIVFVSPARSTDVLSVLYHSKNSDYYRFMTVKELDTGSFTTSSRPFYSGQIDEIKQCEILPLNELRFYRNFLDIDYDRPGADAEKVDGKRAQNIINKMLEA